MSNTTGLPLGEAVLNLKGAYLELRDCASRSGQGILIDELDMAMCTYRQARRRIPRTGNVYSWAVHHWVRLGNELCRRSWALLDEHMEGMNYE